MENKRSFKQKYRKILSSFLAEVTILPGRSLEKEKEDIKGLVQDRTSIYTLDGRFFLLTYSAKIFPQYVFKPAAIQFATPQHAAAIHQSDLLPHIYRM